MSENSRRISRHLRMICCDSNEFGKTHLNSTINEAVAGGEVSSVILFGLFLMMQSEVERFGLTAILALYDLGNLVAVDLFLITLLIGVAEQPGIFI
ncbi:hypothetical protein F6Q07_18415 [Pectobacterium parmentieri]|uniref:Uncharacterized protein n=1 Tax=Pectobacterium parmentieri TaxID=1905730 RepID=A0A0H3I667_PECPM|nr:Hypothetical protein W5S_3404 [Pectobacterium parmentieri]AYH02538.1 hypothetical protein C5E26_17165 [Pectobacterium parmentieri]AYH06802.1 hypothetical protein C5E25_16290 [Pectobacterium parmentieri]AYH11355.1 hypothetical protein C5E24_17505 [Pectobacterium parmentieri]AYH15616.1 hypothetical protein C5E23_16250 [Pectobacterium parmentieri]